MTTQTIQVKGEFDVTWIDVDGDMHFEEGYKSLSGALHEADIQFKAGAKSVTVSLRGRAGPMIYPQDHDIGRRVIYTPLAPGAPKETGTIFSFNVDYVFVVYGPPGSTPAATSRQDLEWEHPTKNEIEISLHTADPGPDNELEAPGYQRRVVGPGDWVGR